MPQKYNSTKIEKRWQKEWQKQKLYAAKVTSKKEKYYVLVEFPYPSGEGLHVGHVRSYTAMDVIARKRRMEGYNVLYPIGWDAFGLPTEQYAIKNKIHPRMVTKKNTDNFRRQLQSLGFSFDWTREINTSDPAYYKWTQWIFLKLFEAGLAYKARTIINWCPNCKIGLANEEIEYEHCERCGGEVEEREKEQWMLMMTKYTEKLLTGLNNVNYIDEIKTQQRHWIGKSEGARIKFKVISKKQIVGEVEVFTTRPDTIYGATFLVLGPEHKLLVNNELGIMNYGEVKVYIDTVKKKTNVSADKTGIMLKGLTAINPATNEEISVWVADYVLGDVGTGAIMAVPAHDERDFAFAKKNWLDIVPVIVPETSNGDTADHVAERLRGFMAEEVYTGEGVLRHSGEFDGMNSEEAKWKIAEKVGGKKETHYRLQDWVFSRQRYWGEPIPLVFCKNCKEWVPVPEKDLPVELPDVKNYEPREDSESPLASISKWVRVTCPRCGEEARRETDTMPNWAGSSWYFLRYVDPQNEKEFAAKKKLEYWMGVDSVKNSESSQSSISNGVDWYNGGMEHATRHLLYSRFWNQFLYDRGYVPVSEPYKKRTAHGLILGEKGVKMSKSKGNVVNPDDLTKQFGADALRLYEMFIGPFDQAVVWDPRGIVGMSRFLARVWKIAQDLNNNNNNDDVSGKNSLEHILHKTIKKVSDDIENLRMNTAVSTLMVLLNKIEKNNVSSKTYKLFLQLLAPFAPHISEEIWFLLGEKKSIHISPWPQYDAEAAKEETFQLVIQVNGIVRATVEADSGISKQEAEQLAFAEERVINALKGKELKKIIFIERKLINFVI